MSITKYETLVKKHFTLHFIPTINVMGYTSAQNTFYITFYSYNKWPIRVLKIRFPLHFIRTINGLYECSKYVFHYILFAQ